MRYDIGLFASLKLNREEKTIIGLGYNGHVRSRSPATARSTKQQSVATSG